MLQPRSVFLLYDLCLCIPAGAGSDSFFIASEKSTFLQDPAHMFPDVAAWDTYHDCGITASRRPGNLRNHQSADHSVPDRGICIDAGQRDTAKVLQGIETFYHWSHYEYFFSN